MGWVSWGVTVCISAIAILIMYTCPVHQALLLIDYCEIEKCPFCYGTDFCSEVENGNVQFDRNTVLSLILARFFNVKNINFGYYKNTEIIIKKLAHNSELEAFYEKRPGNLIITQETIYNFLQRVEFTNLRSCNNPTSRIFLEKLTAEAKNYEEIWTMLNINAEPLILKILHEENANNWPVAKTLGSCGLITIQTNCGQPLNHFENYPWTDRIFIARQLLQAGINFTGNHQHFRFYLTDISSDNIVVDSHTLKVYFIDLENVILIAKLNGTGGGVIEEQHYSRHFNDGDEFVYSEDEICASSISDHNVYAICRLLLSQSSPWPMMQNGLLHSPPPLYQDRAANLFKLIELCVDDAAEAGKFSDLRFRIANQLIRIMNGILDDDDDDDDEDVGKREK